MSFPCGSTGPFFVLDGQVGKEIAAHRERVFAAFSRHSDPAVREIGRLLATRAVIPPQPLENPRHADPLDRAERTPAEPTQAERTQAERTQAEQMQAEKALDELRRRVFGPTVPFGPPLNGAAPPQEPARTKLEKPARPSRTQPMRRAGARHPHPAGPASRADFTDPDNGSGGVPAIRR